MIITFCRNCKPKRSKKYFILCYIKQLYGFGFCIKYHIKCSFVWWTNYTKFKWYFYRNEHFMWKNEKRALAYEVLFYLYSYCAPCVLYVQLPHPLKYWDKNINISLKYVQKTDFCHFLEKQIGTVKKTCP